MAKVASLCFVVGDFLWSTELRTSMATWLSLRLVVKRNSPYMHAKTQ